MDDPIIRAAMQAKWNRRLKLATFAAILVLGLANLIPILEPDMDRESFELWLDENPRLTEALITLFILFAMGLAGWVDGPLVYGF